MNSLNKMSHDIEPLLTMGLNNEPWFCDDKPLDESSDATAINNAAIGALTSHNGNNKP